MYRRLAKKSPCGVRLGLPRKPEVLEEVDDMVPDFPHRCQHLRVGDVGDVGEASCFILFPSFSYALCRQYTFFTEMKLREHGSGRETRGSLVLKDFLVKDLQVESSLGATTSSGDIP